MAHLAKTQIDAVSVIPAQAGIESYGRIAPEG